MKTLIKPLFLALSLSVVAVSISEAKPVRPAAVSFKTGIYSSANSKLNIALDKQTGGSVEIQFKNSAGERLYTQRLGKKETTYRTRLNLEDLADGEYVLEITNGVETTRQTITLKTQQPTVASRIVQTDAVAANE